jgi:peptidyl-prolyl cis-trans isomerase SurA
MAYIKILKSFILIIILSAAVSAHAEVINRVYAVVGDKVITQYELETLNPKRLQMIYERFKGDKREEELSKYYLQALDLLIDNYVIEQAAAKEGVRVSDRELSNAIQEIMVKNNVDEEKLTELLAASNQTLEQYKWKIKIDILKARLMSIVFRPKIVITEEDISEYVSKNADSLELSDMYELRIMTVPDDKTLENAMSEFKKTDNFRETAMKYSTAGSAENGGYLGWVELAFLDKDVRDAVSGIKKGVAEPVKSDDGYRVFYVEGFKTKDNLDKNKRDEIVNAMQEQQSIGIFENWLVQKKKEILIQKKYAN